MNLENQRAQAKSQKVQVAVSIGETLLSSFLGRKSSTRATRSAREIARQRKEAKDQENAEDNLKALEKERAQLEKKFQSEINLNETKSNSLTEDLAKVFISPSKADVTVRLLALVWTL
jgi:DNA-binding ferritin-like protein